MKISAKGHYAVMAMLDLSRQPEGTPTPLSDIALRQDISLTFLEQLFVKLRRGQLVKSVRGPGGGYLLAKKAEDIPIGAILRTVGEDFSVSTCGNNNGGSYSKDCKKINGCPVNKLWKMISLHLTELTESIDLKKLHTLDSEIITKYDQNNKLRFRL